MNEMLAHQDDPSQAPLVIGVDVGGTNTDAVLLRGATLLRTAKIPTSTDVSIGLEEAVRSLSVQEDVAAVFVGTTALVNALLEGRGLSRVAAVRLCGHSARGIPPLEDFPSSLRQVVSAGTWFASGGLRFDGTKECELDEKELVRIANEIGQIERKVDAVVVCGTFSPSDDSQERRAADILRQHLPAHIQVSISSTSGRLGILARENCAVLNACLSSTARNAAGAARRALYAAGVPKTARLFFTANDGSVVSFAKAAQTPLRCVACGPTNSLRGAGFLASSSMSKPREQPAIDSIVLDVGGTSTDAGCLVGGSYPRDANAEAYVAGVRCNHRMVDVCSIALGGGSIVTDGGDNVGPESVGAEIYEKALCFGGNVCTATCVAVAMRGTDAVAEQSFESQFRDDFDLPASVAAKAWDVMQKKFYDLVERSRTDNKPVEIIVVGGGAILVDANRLAHVMGKACRRVVLPKYGAVANACGSALAHAVGEAETIQDLSSEYTRKNVLNDLKTKACMSAGPAAKVVECEEIPLAYLPGKTTRVFVRAVAPLDLSRKASTCTTENDDSEFLHDTSAGEKPPALRQRDEPPLSPSEPHVEDGVWLVSEYDARCLAVGCGILGCGGGGNTHFNLLQVLAAIREGTRIRIVSPHTISDEDWVSPCGYMGAPTVSVEMLRGPDQLVDAINRNLEVVAMSCVRGNNPQRSPAFVIPAEVGGGNGLIALVVGGVMDRPVVDADLMGRAFPELQMMTTAIYGLPQIPMTASDSFGRCVSLTGPSTAENERTACLVPADEFKWTERVLRPICVEFGCYAGLADTPLKGNQLRQVGVLGSLTRARRIGDCILRSARPREAIDTLLERESGRLLFEGKVVDVRRETSAGFARGTITLLAGNNVDEVTIDFQNEFLIARRSGEASKPDTVLGCVPDILTLLDADSARPIATEEVRFGFRVYLLLLPISPLLRSPEALRVVGPAAFGLETEYKSSLYNGEGSDEKQELCISDR